MTRSPRLGGMVNGSGLAATLGPARVGSHRVASLRRRLGQGAKYRVGDKLGRASHPCACEGVGDGGPIGVGVACTASGGELLYGSFRSCLELVDGAGGDRAALDQGDMYAPGVEHHPQRVIHGDERAPGGAEGATEGHSVRPPTEATFTIRPVAARIKGRKACVTTRCPNTLTSNWRLNTSSGQASPMPALFTSPAIPSPPTASSTVDAAAATRFSSVTSMNSGVRRPAGAASSSAPASSSFLTPAKTRNPERAHFIAEARPIPLEAPVTTTALGRRSMCAEGTRDLLQIMPFSFECFVCVAMQQPVYDASTVQGTLALPSPACRRGYIASRIVSSSRSAAAAFAMPH